MYAGAVTRDGLLYTWGYGGHGNLGHGDRKSQRRPKLVAALADDPNCLVVVQVACTRGQVGCKGGLNPDPNRGGGGTEGPHTNVITADGQLFTFGTCHKGTFTNLWLLVLASLWFFVVLLATIGTTTVAEKMMCSVGVLLNLGSKTGGFGSPYDELLPYRVGSKIRNGTKFPPLSRWSVWPPPYTSIGRVIFTVSAHIHAAAITSDGRAYAWGCGSNDGRCGVERFLNGNKPFSYTIVQLLT